jgi:hypothetical protein
MQKELMCGAGASSAGQAEQCAGSCKTPSSNDPSAGYSVSGSSVYFHNANGWSISFLFIIIDR